MTIKEAHQKVKGYVDALPPPSPEYFEALPQLSLDDVMPTELLAIYDYGDFWAFEYQPKNYIKENPETHLIGQGYLTVNKISGEIGATSTLPHVFEQYSKKIRVPLSEVLEAA